MGSILHRIQTCIAVAIRVGSPCLVDDSNLEYDPKNLSKYFSDTDICTSAASRNKRVPLFSTELVGSYRDYVLTVPLAVKNSLDYCHENPAAWYRGVILKHMLRFTSLSEESIRKHVKESRILSSNAEISEITSVHIRSTEKRTYEKVLPAQQATDSFLPVRNKGFRTFSRKL